MTKPTGWRLVVRKLNRGDSMVELRPRVERRMAIPLDPKACRQIANSLRNNRRVRTLRLIECGVDGEGGRYILEALSKNDTLDTLDLSLNCRVDFSIASTLGHVLIHRNKTLRHLSLVRNNIGTTGALVLAQVLKHNTSLSSLNVYGNGIGIEGTIAIMESLEQNETLQMLDIGFNQVGTPGATAMANCLRHNKTLLELSLDSSWIGDQEGTFIAEALKVNRGLQKLDLSGNALGVSSAVAVAECLEQNICLKELYLVNNSTVGDTGVIAIAEGLMINESLKKLSLRCCGMESHGARALSKTLLVNSVLEDLDLSRNFLIGDDGTRCIAQTLGDTKCTLSILDISLTTLTTYSTACATDVASALKHNTSLCVLGLSLDRDMSREDRRWILKALHLNTTLQELGPTSSEQVERIMKRNKVIAKKQPVMLRQENLTLGLWPYIVAKWPPNVVFGIFREKPDPLLSNGDYAVVCEE